jgi:hypothetical protein
VGWQEMLAEVTGLPQYKQVFIAAYIHGTLPHYTLGTPAAAKEHQ